MSHFERTCKRYLTHDTLHQGGLSLAILAHKCHLLTTLDCKRYTRKHGVRTIIFAQLVADNGIIATAQARWKLEVHTLVVHLVHLDRHYFLQLSNALLHLHRLSGLIAETLYEGFGVGYLLLLVFISPQLLFTSLGSQGYILIVFHLIVLYLPTGYL